MVDIHHHLLPGLDDGSPDLETSVAMARLAVADGITHVSCSPHANQHYPFDPERNEFLMEELQERLAVEAIPLTLGLGCDFHISYDNVQEALAHPTRYTINGLGYLLIELPDYGLPAGLSETFHRMQQGGITLILTHPERNPTLQADPGRLVDWLRLGVLIQVTADSVLGKMGRQAQRVANLLLERRWVHFLATDAHNTTSRPPRMSEASRLVEKQWGLEYARALCLENPMAAFLGKPMPPQSEPLQLDEPPGPRTWLDRLLRR